MTLNKLRLFLFKLLYPNRVFKIDSIFIVNLSPDENFLKFKVINGDLAILVTPIQIKPKALNDAN